jgi:NAD(P)-dependent dehydrogenase (short-subunit alcohol dehydrogenase family)
MAFKIDGMAVVTGAGPTSHPCWIQNTNFSGSGIGKAVALAYAAEGARGVAVVDLKYEAAMGTVRHTKSIATNPAYQALAIAVDVTDLYSINSMVQTVVWWKSSDESTITAIALGLDCSSTGCR